MKRNTNGIILWSISAILLCLGGHAYSMNQTSGNGTISDPYGVAIEAQRNYDEGMAALATDPAGAQVLFTKSAELYQMLADIPLASGELNYNLGNAWIQAGDPGRAIAALLDAQLLLPGDARVAESLAHARAIVAPPAASASSEGLLDIASTWWVWLSPSLRRLLAVTLWLALWLVVAFGVWTRWKSRAPWRSVIASLALASAAVTATVVVDVLRTTLHPPGVITSESTIARKGNGEGFAAAFSEPLKRGMEFTLIEVRPDWVHVRLRDGQSAWVRSIDAHVAGQWQVDRRADTT